jgi:hypothetical protein
MCTKTTSVALMELITNFVDERCEHVKEFQLSENGGL